MYKINYFLLVALVWISLPIKAQVLTYDSIKVIILSNHPELRMYDNQVKSYNAMATGARAWDAPQIGAGFFMTPYRTSAWKPQVMDINGMQSMSPGMGSFMIQGSQMIPNPSRLNANQKYLMAMSSVETENKIATENVLLSEAKIYYSQLQIIDKKILVITEAENTLQTMITFSENTIAYNQGSLSALYKARAQLAVLTSDRLMLENERKQKMYQLNTLMNRTKEIKFQIDTTFKIEDYEKEYIDTTLIFSNRSDLLAIDKNIEVFYLRQKVETYKGRPDFGIQYGHMFAFGQTPNQFTLMGMMSIPIAPWSSKMYKSSTLATDYQIQALRNQKEIVVNESIGMLYGLQNEIKTAKHQLNLYETLILPALQKTYDAAMIAYTQNTGELFEALDARMNLQMAKMQYYDVILKILTLQSEYEKQLQIY